MATEYDVAVVGSGVAGTAAALAAAQKGARVCVLTGPPAATALFSGAWRGECPTPLRAALDRTGYPLRAAATHLPHPTGVRVAADFATATHAFVRIPDALVVGIAGLPGFNAHVLAAQWHARAATVLQLDDTPAAGWSPLSLAAHIERNLHAFADRLKLHSRGVSQVILPAILGLRYDDTLRSALEAAAGCSIAEALGVPPSVPGLRLDRALRSTLAHANITVIEQRALAAQHANGRVASLTLLAGDVVHARTFVLASGKFVGGGITSDGAFREPIFDCPVWVDHLGEIFEEADALNLTDAVRTEEQPLLKAGVHANAGHRPVDRGGDVVYANVLVAGSIRAGWSADTHGAGDAAQDGWNAGLEAVRA